MRSTITERQIQAMAEHGLDAILACSPENFAYVAGFVVPSQALLRHRHAFAIVTSDRTTAMLGVDMEASTIQSRDPATPLTVWREFCDDPMQILASLLHELNLDRGRIGIELSYLPAADLDRLRTALPNAAIVAADAVLSRLRQIKTPEELELLGRLSRIADRAITDALGAVSPGDTEMDIAAEMTRRVYELGAEQFKLMIVATGERSQLPNVGPTTRRLERGDVCRVEIFAVAEGYHAGVCRTAVVQEPPPHAEAIWQILVDCKYDILDQIRPGASCRAVYDRFIARLDEHGLPPIAFVGHGIGLFLHEEPYLGANPMIRSRDDATLEAGMVLGIEPLCYRTGHGFGMQNKDMLAVTEDGCRLLSDYADTDRLLVVS